jgi:DNA replication protein DnaC
MVCIACRPDDYRRFLAKQMGISEEMAGYVFKNVKQHQRESAKTLYARAKDPAWFVTLWGAPGTGKTYLLAATLNRAAEFSHRALYTTSGRLLSDLKAGFDIDGEYERRLKHYAAVPVLALDECDRFNATEWARERMSDLINVRYEHGAERLTLFATNADPSSFEPYVWSRMSDKRSAVYRLVSPDLRRQA